MESDEELWNTRGASGATRGPIQQDGKRSESRWGANGMVSCACWSKTRLRSISIPIQPDIGGNDGHSAGRYRKRGENKWNNSQQPKICRRYRSDGGKRKLSLIHISEPTRLL